MNALPATPIDAVAVRELLLDYSYRDLLQADYDADLLETALPMITTARPELLTCGTWYVVEAPSDAGATTDTTKTSQLLVGCGGWTRQSPATDDDANLPHLRHFATHPDWIRKGIARAIWDCCRTDWENEGGGMPSTLEVYSTLTAAPFYASLGFRNVREMEIPLGEGACRFPCILMKRDDAETK